MEKGGERGEEGEGVEGEGGGRKEWRGKGYELCSGIFHKKR